MAAADPRTEVLVLGALGTVLIATNAIVLFALGSAPFAPAVVSNVAYLAGGIALLIALALGVLLYLYSDAADTNAQVTYSTLIVIAGGLALFVGGGFNVGTLFTVVAGVLGIVLARLPDSLEEKEPSTKSPADLRPPPTEARVPRPSNAPTSSVPPSMSSVVWFCMRCGATNRPEDSNCIGCGAARGTKA